MTENKLNEIRTFFGYINLSVTLKEGKKHPHLTNHSSETLKITKREGKRKIKAG